MTITNVRQTPAWRMKQNDRTFGVEIEFGLKNESLNNFKDEFEMRTGEKVNITNAYNTEVSNTHWTLAVDTSVSVRGYIGRELKSPPIKLSEIDRLKKVYNYLNEVGKVNKSCGHHVHIDANDMTFKQQKKVLIAYLVNEDVIDMMHPISRRFGRGVGSQYCGSGQGRHNVTSDNTAYDSSVDTQSRRLQSHYKSVVINECIKKIKKARNVRKLQSQGFAEKYSNVQLVERFGTIEFRQHAGTLEFAKISNWIIFLNNFILGYGFGPSIAIKDETRDNGRDRLFFRKVSQLEKSTKARVKKYGGFDIVNSDRSFEFLKGRVSHFVRTLTGDTTYEKALRIVLEKRGVTFNLRTPIEGGNNETDVH